MRTIVRPWAVLLSTAGSLLVTYFTIRGSFGGQPLGQDPNPALVLPADATFGIWSLIYPAWLAYAVYQALPTQRQNLRLRAAAPWVVANAFVNALWLPLAYHGYKLLPLVLIFGYLITLIGISAALQIGRQAVPRPETWLARVPFGLYFGWITAACAVASADCLKAYGVGGLGLGEPAWAITLLLVVAGLSLGAYHRFPNPAYLVAVAWAELGIAVAERPTVVRLAAATVAVVVSVAAGRRREQPAEPSVAQ